MRAEGMLAGVPDVLVARVITATNGKVYGGLWIEFKVRGNKPTDAQRDMHARLRDAGYAVEVCYSVEDAMSACRGYLERHEHTSAH